MFEGRYTLWGGEHSYFTRKLQAMLNYLALAYEFKPKSAETGPDLGLTLFPAWKHRRAGLSMTPHLSA